MHGGFVGRGMLDAACPGEVFTSPTPDQMEWATRKVDGGAGVLHIVKNYSGDVMNFEMAADLAREGGTEVESVVIDDDVAVKDSLYTQGRRGVGGTVLLEKLVGALAEEGADLAAVAELARDVVEAVEQDSGKRLEDLRVDGGSVKNNFLMQLQADILGIPVIRPQVQETTALGAAYLAGLATGYWSSLDEMRENWQVDRTFEPQWSEDQRESGYAQWKKAIERTRGWVE